MRFHVGDRIRATSHNFAGIVLSGDVTRWEGESYYQVKLNCERDPTLIREDQLRLDEPMEVTVRGPREMKTYSYVVQARDRQGALERALELEKGERPQ